MKGIYFSFLVLVLAGLNLSQTNGKVSKKLLDSKTDELLRKLSPHQSELQRWFDSLLTDKELGRADYLTCDICTPAIAFVRPLLQQGATQDELINAISKICQILDLAPADDICKPTIGSYAKPVLYIVKNRPDLADADFCGIINEDCGEVNKTLTSWEIIIDENKPVVETPPPLSQDLDTVKILQFTDIHLDLDYEEGTNADCVYPICCRSDLAEKPIYENMTAGPFGHYKCGLPLTALTAMFSHARENHADAKYIFLTGDYVHSGVWLYNVEENSRHITQVTKLLRDTFADTEMKIFPLTGNHETDIVNMYPPYELQSEFPLEWMYEAVSSPFAQWMGPEQVELFKIGGYYTVSPEPGLRLVILNTNLCYIQNFWLPYEPIDPEGQLQWFSDTLFEAEKANENVLIIGHISPGSGSCWPVWSAQFQRIIERYHHLIRAQFYGHSHNEYFNLAFDSTAPSDEKPISIMYIAPSALTDGKNPGYKAYYFDGKRQSDSTWEMVDHETWILNVTESNKNKAPAWLKEYSAKETFGLESLRPEAYYKLVLEMVEDRDLFEKFHLFYEKSSDLFEKCSDAKCIYGHLCDTVVANSADLTHCKRIERLVNATFATGGEDNTGTGAHLSDSLLNMITTLLAIASVYIYSL